MCIAPCFAIFQCVFNVHLMYIQCIFNKHSIIAICRYQMCIAPFFAIFQCVFNVHSMYIKCTFNVHLMFNNRPAIWLIQTDLLTHSHTPNLEMLSHLKSSANKSLVFSAILPHQLYKP